MNLEELDARITALEDIEKIKKLQNIYGYYFDAGEHDDIIDLFSENAVSFEGGDHGVFFGKAGVIKFFREILGKMATPPPELSLHLVIMYQPVVNIDPGGKTAKGRWHGWMCGTRSQEGKPIQTWGHGIYENEFVKEGSEWKFSKLHYNVTFRTPYEDGWLKTPFIGGTSDDPIKPDAPPTALHPYPSGYTVPYHWK